MEINLIPNGGVIGPVVFLPGGGFSIIIPPGTGFTLNVNPVGVAAGGVAAGGAGAGGVAGGGAGAGGAGAGGVAGEGVAAEGVAGGGVAAEGVANEPQPGNEAQAAIAAITADILQHSVDDRLSVSQVLHLLFVDNTIQVHDIHVDRPINNFYLYDMHIVRRHDFHGYIYPMFQRRQNVEHNGEVVQIRYRRGVAHHPHDALFRLIEARKYIIEGHDRYLVHYLEIDEDLAFIEEEAPWIPLEPVVPPLL